MGQHGYNHGDIGWTQLNTMEPEKTIDFYAALFGWEKKPAPMPDYHVFARGSEMLGGVTSLLEGSTSSQWIPYVTVKDMDETLAKLEALGGSVVAPPAPLPDGGRMALIRDPQGGVTGLAQYAQGPSKC